MMKTKTWIVYSLVLFSSVSCVSKQPDKVSPTPEVATTDAVGRASYNIQVKDGVQLIELVLNDGEGSEKLAMVIAPEAGSNIVSLRYQGVEVLEQPKSIPDIAKQDAGIEFLYPTPNRVRNGELNYKDLKLKFAPNLQGHFIHGLAREYGWTWSRPTLSDDKIVYQTVLKTEEGSDFHKRFPIRNQISMTITLEHEKVIFDFKVDNLDPKPLPFGVGIHPYFALHGKREESSVEMHVKNQMEAKDLLPTGKLIPLKKTKYAKLPKGMTVQDVLGADTVFWPTQVEKRAVVSEPGFQFEIATSKDFGHTVLWAPPTRDLFAVENQTSSTDAHNLANRGFHKESGLLEIAPGATWSGWVSYRFSNQRAK